MINRRTHIAKTIICFTIFITGPIASSSAAQTDELRSAVIFAAAESLGADQRVNLEYGEQLASERALIEKGFFCSEKHSLKPLSESVTQLVVSRTLSDLEKQNFASIIGERPSYVTDLIVTAVASFELGRVVSISPSEAAKICAPAVAPAPPSVEPPAASVTDPGATTPPAETPQSNDTRLR